jgi:hypothetical protein
VYVVHTNYPGSVVAPTANLQQQQQHHHLQTTSHQARLHGCDIVATNGGPYNADGTSSGPLVMQGTLITTNNTSTDFVGFGTTTSEEWVLGTFDDAQSTTTTTLWDFVTGFGWLVYDHQVVANNSDNPTGAYRAARTAIGLDDHGNLL